jgi:MFS family permease
VSEPSPPRRVALASFVGTTVEFFDFFIYGTAAALVFRQVFFPALGAAAGTVAAIATFAVAFLARPLGSVLFGRLGDRVGALPETRDRSLRAPAPRPLLAEG